MKYLPFVIIFLAGLLTGIIINMPVNPSPPEPQNMYDVDYPEEISQISTDPARPDTFTMYRVDGTDRLLLGYANEANKEEFEQRKSFEEYQKTNDTSCGCPN